LGLSEDIKVSLELSFGITDQKQDALKRAPTQANRRYRTDGKEPAGDAGATKQKRPGWSRGALSYRDIVPQW
jgi:hypothetical protein